jgi:hypothetical protein
MWHGKIFALYLIDALQDSLARTCVKQVWVGWPFSGKADSKIAIVRKGRRQVRPVVSIDQTLDMAA